MVKEGGISRNFIKAKQGLRLSRISLQESVVDLNSSFCVWKVIHVTDRISGDASKRAAVFHVTNQHST